MYPTPPVPRIGKMCPFRWTSVTRALRKRVGLSSRVQEHKKGLRADLQCDELNVTWLVNLTLVRTLAFERFKSGFLPSIPFLNLCHDICFVVLLSYPSVHCQSRFLLNPIHTALFPVMLLMKFCSSLLLILTRCDFSSLQDSSASSHLKRLLVTTR